MRHSRPVGSTTRSGACGLWEVHSVMTCSFVSIQTYHNEYGNIHIVFPFWYFISATIYYLGQSMKENIVSFHPKIWGRNDNFWYDLAGEGGRTHFFKCLGKKLFGEESKNFRFAWGGLTLMERKQGEIAYLQLIQKLKDYKLLFEFLWKLSYLFNISHWHVLLLSKMLKLIILFRYRSPFCYDHFTEPFYCQYRFNWI